MSHEANRETETPPVWYCEDLPPVGTVCLMTHPGLEDWHVVEIVAYRENRFMDSGKCVIIQTVDNSLWDNGVAAINIDLSLRFRPLPTTEQKAVDKIHAVIMAIPDDTDTRVAAQDIYNAIRGGKVPGVGLTGEEG